jgi:hypothetical protein
VFIGTGLRLKRTLADRRRNDMADKRTDLAGPGIGNYGDLARDLPSDYEALLSPMARMKAVFAVKNYIETKLCKELNLQMVQVPLIVDKESGVNDYLDRDGSRTPVEFACGLGLDPPIQAQVVQAATKWKRMALQQFDCKVGEGICTDMRALRKDYFLDHDHSAYVDQWDCELVVTPKERTLDFLKDIVSRIWKVIWGAVKTDLPNVFAQYAGYGDLAASVLAFLALLAIRCKWPVAMFLVWVFNIEGTIDLVTAISLGVANDAASGMGATYWIPSVIVPALLVTHYIIFVLLLRAPSDHVSDVA